MDNAIPDPLNNIRICELPDMRMLSSVILDGEGKPINDMAEGLNKWADANGVLHRPGMREEFAYWDGVRHMFVFLLRIPDSLAYDGPYPELRIQGGLEAVVSGERDHLVPRCNAMEQWIHENDRYERENRHDYWLDWLTPFHINKRYDFEQQDIFIPIRLKSGR